MNDKIKILVADDHPIMREGLKWILEKEFESSFIYEAKDGEEAFNLIKKNNIDIATLDIEMPLLSGLEVARKIKEEKLITKVVFLTMYNDEQMFDEAMNIGALGYVLKENAIENIVECIKQVVKGFNYISPALSHFIVKREREYKKLAQNIPSVNDLTKSERIILRLISDDKTTKQISEELHISYKTVENHRNNIARKLGLTGTHSLIKFALTNKSIL
jgi:DNA-binding NarL/FixJ family response regulator